MNDIFYMVNELNGEVPKSIQIIPNGLTATAKGDFLHDIESVDMVINKFSEKKNDTVIDYEHQSLTGATAPAAGWIKSQKMINKGSEGTWADVEWTPKAEDFIKNKEYKYVSPVIMVRKSDKRVVELVNVALTNTPNIDGMIPLINSKLGLEDLTNKKGGSMDRIFETLGLSKEATEDMAVNNIINLKSSVKQQVNKATVEKAVCEALDLTVGSDLEAVLNKISIWKNNSDEYNTQVVRNKQLEDKIAKMKADEIVEFAMKKGKLAPSQKEWAHKYAMADYEAFKEYVNNAPQIVPVGEVALGKDGKVASIDNSQKFVNNMLGISDETYAKFSQLGGNV